MIARRYVVSGRVQRVGFRQFVVLAAKRLGVAGWTRNRHDGAVEVFAQAEADVMEKLAAELSVGPAWARVERLDVEEQNVDPAIVDFSVRW